MFIWELNIFFAATVAYGKEISEAESSAVWLRPIDFFLCQDVGLSASTCHLCTEVSFTDKLEWECIALQHIKNPPALRF